MISSLIRRLWSTASITSAGVDWVGILTPGTEAPRNRRAMPKPVSSSPGGSSEAVDWYQFGSMKEIPAVTRVAARTNTVIGVRYALTRLPRTARSMVRSMAGILAVTQGEDDERHLTPHGHDVAESGPGIDV